MLMNIKLQLNGLSLYITDSLGNQCSDFDRFLKLREEDKQCYLNDMKSNSRSMYRDMQVIAGLERIRDKLDQTQNTLFTASLNNIIIEPISHANTRSERKCSVNLLSCEFDCQLCQSNIDAILFCLSGDCLTCDAKRKAVREFNSKKIKRDHMKYLYINDGAIEEEIPIDNDILLKYRYYYVILSSDIEDGSETHIKAELTRNFNRLTAPSALVTASIYTITRNENDAIELYGLLKQKTGTGSICISNKSTIFRNNVKKEGTKKSNERPKHIINHTKYVSKEFKTEKSTIVDLWNQINNRGSPIGDSLEFFI
jgi:hypothetical protein